MKKNRFFIIGIIALCLGLAGGAVGIAGMIDWWRWPSRPVPPSTPTANITCMESAEYFVVDNNPGLPGLDVIAKHKTTTDETFPCTAATAMASSSDVILKNDLPEFVLGIAGGHFLIVDSGTAPPPRGLIVYDLDSGSQTPVFTDHYDEPITAATSTVTYWQTTKQAVTESDCPDANAWSAEGLGAVVESRVTLQLPTLAVMPFGQQRCEPTQ